MSSDDERLPDDLHELASQLSESRETFSAFELDAMRARLARRVERRHATPRRSLAARLRIRSVAGLLTLGLMLSSGAGAVIAATSIGGGVNQTFQTTSFHNMRDASWCQYHGPYTITRIVPLRHGFLTIIIVWDCRHLIVHISFSGPFYWHFGGGQSYGSNGSDWNGDAPDGATGLTVNAGGSNYTMPFSW